MVVSTADRLRPVPVALTREADVLAALDRLGPSATGHNPDQVSGLPTSGLLAMSIPASFGERISRTSSSPRPSAD